MEVSMRTVNSVEMIKKLCAKEGIGVTQLEKKLGYGNGTIARSQNMRSDRLYEIANYFGVSMEYLMTGVDPNSFYGRIIQLCNGTDISVEELEKQLKLSPGASGNWKLQLPSQALLQKIATHFGISVDFLMFGEEQSSWNPTILTTKDEKDIAKRLEKTLDDLSEQDGMMFFGEPLDDETKELLQASLENSLRIAKINAKQKFTPHKYRK